MNFLKNLFASSRSTRHKQEAVIYKGFKIQPCPAKSVHGWTVEAVITLEKDGRTHVHRFVRADILFNCEEAVQLTLSKAQAMIDQAGEKMFADR